MQSVVVVIVLLALTLAPVQAVTVRVAAAASLGDVLPSVAHAFRRESPYVIQFNFAASNTLARQIIEGARVDVFVSADEAQMDAIERAGRVVQGTRTAVLGNALVIIVPVDAAVTITTPADLVRPEVRRIALGDPQGVPAGVYARQWLTALGLYDAIAPRVVPLPSSPAAMAAVAEGRAQAGIVYATDARAGRVRVSHVVQGPQAPAIVYPGAAITGGELQGARAFLGFLRSDAARAIFSRAGFRAPPSR